MSAEKNAGQRFVVVRVRGLVRVDGEIAKTLTLMGLHRKNYATIVEEKDLGMIKKVKDFVTYGEIDSETEKLLISKRGEQKVDREGKTVAKRFFRLMPPRKGFGRRGIKTAFTRSGALGYRGAAINDLVTRMI